MTVCRTVCTVCTICLTSVPPARLPPPLSLGSPAAVDRWPQATVSSKWKLLYLLGREPVAVTRRSRFAECRSALSGSWRATPGA